MSNDTILNYINSKDIRNHLKTIGHQFTSLEAAWLIYQCKSLTLAQKHEAWNDLISTMPDMPIECLEEISLHGFLRRCINVENRWIEEFKQADNCVYSFTLITQDDDLCSYKNCDIFSSYENCLNAVKPYVAELDGSILRIRITKKRIDGLDDTLAEKTSYMGVNLNHNFEIESKDSFDNNPPDEDSATHYNFEEIGISFPIPFKKGDIIYDPSFTDDTYIGPMVMDEMKPMEIIVSDLFAEEIDYEYNNSVMVVSGYFQDYMGSIHNGSATNYMNYEYYPAKKLHGKRRILLAISNLLKGEIDIGLCLNAYHQIMLEESAKTHMPREYTEEE